VEHSRLTVRDIFASERDVAGVVPGGYCVHEKEWVCTWKPVTEPMQRSILGVGPSGLVAWQGGGLGAIGDSGCVVDVDGVDDEGKPFTFADATFDGSNRVWTRVQNGFRVIDERGRIAAEYRAGMLDGLDGELRFIIVPGGGPKSFPTPKSRRSVDVAGRLTVDGSGRALSGATVTARIGGGALRRATSDASGAFRLTSVPEGSYEIAVSPPADEPACPAATSHTGFELRTKRDCPPDKVTEAGCDLGVLSQCKQVTPLVGP
jgi:hypothetical protein